MFGKNHDQISVPECSHCMNNIAPLPVPFTINAFEKTILRPNQPTWEIQMKFPATSFSCPGQLGRELIDGSYLSVSSPLFL